MIIDAHCDALWKLWEDKSRSFHNSPELQVNYEKWKRSSVKVQCFAIFVPDTVPAASQFDVALEMVHLFKDQVVDPYDDVVWVKDQETLVGLKPGQRGAILTLEGCHSIGSELARLKTLVELGVRSVGLTWNQGNAVADGIEESRGGGLTDFGKQVVEYLNHKRVWIDVSHLSYKGFWDCMDVATYPMASHSNVYHLASHKRNLDDHQLKALIDRKAFIGVTFVSEFLTCTLQANQVDVINHINAIVSLGGEQSVGLGSDFDGTDKIVSGLEDMIDYDSFLTTLSSYYSKEFIDQLCYKNFVRTFPR